MKIIKISRKKISYGVLTFVFYLSLFTSGGFAENIFLKTNISDLQQKPAAFYGKDVEVRAYFFKTDDMWVKSLDEPDKYIGLFVTKPEGNVASFLGEYFGFIFVPEQIQAQLRLLKLADKITIRGKCFEFKSISIDGPGIKASEILVGWDTQAKPAAASVPVTKEEVISLIKTNTAATTAPATSESIVMQPQVSMPVRSENPKYNLHLNGKEYQGLTFGDEYTFEGIRFRVDKTK